MPREGYSTAGYLARLLAVRDVRCGERVVRLGGKVHAPRHLRADCIQHSQWRHTTHGNGQVQQPRELDNAMPSLTECPLADESVARLNVRRDEVCLVADRISSDAGEEKSAVRRCGRTPRPWVDNKASTPATPSSMTRRQQPSACASPPLLRRRRPSSCSCKFQLQPCWPARVANTALMAASATHERQGRRNAPWELVSVRPCC